MGRAIADRRADDGGGRSAGRGRASRWSSSSRRSSTSCGAAGSRCPSFTTHIFTGLGEDDFDSGTATGRTPMPEDTSVMFDFGGVVDGYCSDFGRTVYCGEPAAGLPRRLRRRCSPPTRPASPRRGPAHAPATVNAACRAPIEDAGLGEHFRHRMGHGIGMDVHERPFLSTEDETPLEPGMTFTDEPSIIIPGRCEPADRERHRGRGGRRAEPQLLSRRPPRELATSARPSSRRPSTPSCRRRSSGRTSTRTPASAA